VARVDLPSGLVPWLMAGQNVAVPNVVVLLARPEWQRKAACRGAAADGPTGHFTQHPGERKRAIAQCWNECEVRTDCLYYALEQEDEIDGVWGGYSKRERAEFKSRKTSVVLDEARRATAGLPAA